MKRGLFLSFEGIEGCGKTTQIRLLSEWLATRQLDAELTREPGGTALGLALRRLLLDPSVEAVSPVAEAFLYLADRAQHVQEKILPALSAGKIVLCDRHADASVVYQGVARGVGREKIAGLNRIATEGLVPDRTFLLDLPVEEGLRRVSIRHKLTTGVTTRMDEEPQDFHEKVRQGYLDLARDTPGRIRIIDASGSESDVHRRIQESLLPLLDNLGE